MVHPILMKLFKFTSFPSLFFFTKFGNVLISNKKVTELHKKKNNQMFLVFQQYFSKPFFFKQTWLRKSITYKVQIKWKKKLLDSNPSVKYLLFIAVSSVYITMFSTFYCHIIISLIFESIVLHSLLSFWNNTYLLNNCNVIV